MKKNNAEKLTYIRLFACCIVVKGFARSIIVDTQRGDYYFIPNSLYEILINDLNYPINDLLSKYRSEEKILQEYLDLLKSKELIFYTNEPENFPSIDTNWEDPTDITNAIIDINKNSAFNIINAVKKIDKLGAEVLQFRFFDPVSEDWLMNFLSEISLQTERIRSFEIILAFNYDYLNSVEQEQLFFDKIENFSLISMLTIHSSLKNSNIKREGITFIQTKDKITNETHCGIVDPIFFAPNIYHVLESMNYNSCLNKKISIDSSGLIKNCPSMKESFGYIDDVSLQEIISNSSFTRKWGVHKQQINVCKDCEFRLICTDCRAYVNDIYDKPSKCHYDPYTMQWN